MYKPSYFIEEDNTKVLSFLKEYSFAVITGQGEQYPVSTHIPLEIIVKDDGSLIFSGHLMKNTDHHKAFLKNENVLVIFNGPHCYISASWYDIPPIASTWNYMSVHAKGKISFTDDKGTCEAIKSITNKYEGTETVAAFNNLSEEYIDRMLKAIVGFTIAIESMENVFKLSQNRSIPDQQNIIDQLMQRGDAQSIAIAQEMKNRLP
jgi:transcriptional regulator